ncbi:MAG: DeoR/GlpR transcriptional regulator [Austwickia sp.]|jgi:DeoR family fructose operon transcriptional repressor|nr:DeoR/GlpR transcriptional regulator [Austwickia sp.]MBK8437262.1 DeoR/GlpR transcriptional regulator [Austwickia sp.]MBK9102495.1 DeoR/GlpR transcriptional regulator [Austwickia sp.]
MYATERQQRIMAEARQAGRVEVGLLTELLGVTSETVRRDLTALEQRGSLRRVHGGAIPVERLEVEPTLDARRDRLAAEKGRIAARALELVPAGGSVIVDAGTTTQALITALPTDIRLTVVTNSLAAATVLSGHPNVELLFLGGRVRGRTGASVGTWATTALTDLCVDVAFMGTNGFSPERGLTTPDQSESLVKAGFVRAARQVVLLADATKYGDAYLHRFATLDQIDLVLTDDSLPDDSAAELTAAGPEVVRA